MEISLALPIKHTDQIKELITRIVNLVMAQQIYRTVRFDDDRPSTELVILLPDKCSKALAEFVPMMDMVFEDYPDYSYRLYFVHQAKNSIKKGNLFFYDVCSAENLYYTDPSVDLDLFPEISSLEELINKAKKAFNTEIAKIQAFNDGADFYWGKENYALAAFMVHQQIELAYRAIELFAMGKDKVTHSIRVHQKHVGQYIHLLGALFDESNDFENKLMQHLDDAYLKVRYGDDYQINKDKLLKAMEKGIYVQKMVAEIYEKMVNDLGQKLRNRKTEPAIVAAGTTAPEVDEAREVTKNKVSLTQYEGNIVRLITNYLTVERVYCIHSHSVSSVQQGIFQKHTVEQNSRHFLLLVITQESGNIDSFNVQNIINQDEDIQATVTLLIHSIKNVNEALTDNNRFFHEVLRADRLIYQSNTVSGLIELPEYDCVKGLSSAKFVWSKRNQRARAMFDAAANIPEPETEIVAISLLHQAVEQVCLGFIFVSAGYKPNQQSLKHLINICRGLTPEFDKVFPLDTKDDKEIFDILIDSVKNTRYRIACSIHPTDVGLLQRRCRAWMDKAEELISELVDQDIKMSP